MSWVQKDSLPERLDPTAGASDVLARAATIARRAAGRTGADRIAAERTAAVGTPSDVSGSEVSLDARTGRETQRGSRRRSAKVDSIAGDRVVIEECSEVGNRVDVAAAPLAADLSGKSTRTRTPGSRATGSPRRDRSRSASRRGAGSGGRVGDRGTGTHGGVSYRVPLRQLDIFESESLPQPCDPIGRVLAAPDPQAGRLDSVSQLHDSPLLPRPSVQELAASLPVEPVRGGAALLTSPALASPLLDAPQPNEPRLPRLWVSLATGIDAGSGAGRASSRRTAGWQSGAQESADRGWDWLRPAAALGVGSLGQDVRLRLGAAALETREGLVWVAFAALAALAWFAV